MRKIFSGDEEHDRYIAEFRLFEAIQKNGGSISKTKLIKEMGRANIDLIEIALMKLKAIGEITIEDIKPTTRGGVTILISKVQGKKQRESVYSLCGETFRGPAFHSLAIKSAELRKCVESGILSKSLAIDIFIDEIKKRSPKSLALV
jgi:hypothetical protein